MTQEIGETRNAMAEGFMKLFEEQLDKNKNEKDYYLLVHAKPLRGQTVVGAKTTFKQVFAKLDVCPPAMLGTIRIYVNNEKGSYKMEVFPHDTPIDQSVYGSDRELVPEVYESAFQVRDSLLYQ